MLRGASGKKGAPPRILAVFLCVILAAPLSLPGGAVWGHNDTGSLVTEQPVLLVSGDALIEGGEYTAANVSNEKSYTLEELLTLDGLITEKLYSAINSSNTRRIYRSEGVDVSGLLALSKYTGGGAVTTIASDGNRVSFDMDTPRYYFPNIGLGTFGGMNESNGAGGEPVTAMLAFRTARSDKGAGAAAEVPLIAPPAEAMQDQALQLQLGQLNVRDVNNSLFNGGVNKLLAGAEITGKPVTVLGTAYTRAQMMMMPRAEGIYTYISSGGERNDRVRGVPLEYLLGDIGGSTAIEFKTADNWGGITAYNMTKAELVAKDAVLAYEMWNQASGEWEGVFSGSGSTRGYFRLYLSGERPAQGISDISVKASHASEYKHINHAGAPYNLDSITGATLTVEGPGVENSVPVTVRQLEETADGNIHKGAYEDLRGGNAAGRMYEGVKVLSILEGLVNPNVIPLDDKVVVVFKNRWRQEVARMSYDEIKNASSPVILAYGTAYTDESKISPFVFIQGAGADSALGNEDGPLKLIYNQGMFPSRQFPSIAYMYVEEGVPPPGFKHITATNEAYNNVENTEFILTFTGDELGKEVNYTVRELEELATANAALSHRDEYSLSNTTYWYVNEYEGIKLWDLLVGMGVNAGKADTGGGPVDNTPLVSFASWDNYQISSQFSFHQLARPELFYFYEKSPLDIGTDRPSKQQLATEEYQPDNQVGDWVRDENNYPVKAGYPVLLAYGVNSYPYVRNPGMEGFKSGLGNSGGPMRLIYGKTDGLNRANPNAEENYAYFFNNGSQQLQRVEEIYVGNNTRYSTHMQNPAQAYLAMKDQQALTVEVTAGGSTQTTTFTLAELESILYGEGVTKRDRDNEGRREKGYYYYRDAGGSPIEDLFEGVNLEYLLTEHIGMQGLLGTVELYNVGGTPAGIYDLSDFGAKGQNSMREVKGLGPMVAFAKNGYPLVAGSNNSGNTSPGYVHDDGATGKAIRNGQGPLLFVRGQTGAEAAAKRIEIGVENRTYVDSLTKIVVNLDPDPYAHTGSEHAALAGQRVNFSGSVAQTGGVSFTVGALETKQRYIVDDEYTIGGVSGSYRGLDLYGLLYDKDIGASTLLSEITVKNVSGESKTLTYNELTGSGKRIILAYGSGTADNAKPLGLADGGPMRLVIDGGAGADCITNVSEIAVSAATITAWKHNFGVYTQYADYVLEVSGQNLIHNKDYTIAELEAMDNIIVQDSYKVGSNTVVVQGLELYKLLQNIGFAEGMESSVFSVYATDGYYMDFTARQLQDGINGKPVLVAFGQGTNVNNGLPLVPDENSPGYDFVSDNQGGPLRFIVEDNSGWSVKFLKRIVVGQAGGNPDPGLIKDFDIHGLKGGATGYSVKELSELQNGMGTKIDTYSYVSGGNTITDTVKGVYLHDLLKMNGVSDNATVTVHTSDRFEATANGANYRDIPMSEIIGMKYFVAYEAGAGESGLSAIADVRNGITAKVRIYRKYDDPPTRMNRMTDVIGVTVADFLFNTYLAGENGFPVPGVRDVALDGSGGVWIGTDGGGAVHISADGAMTLYTTDTSPALRSNTVTSVSIDPSGGVWLSQGGSSDPQGAAYFKDGKFEFYNRENSGLPNDRIYSLDADKDGAVWFATLYNSGTAGTFNGVLTKYAPSTGEWRSWTMEDGFPTVSGWVVKADDKGGAWITSYRDSTLSDIEWKDVSYAYVNAAGELKTYPIDVGTEPRLSTWSRSVAIDLNGGAYVVRSHGGHSPDNVGGYLDYISPDGSVTVYTGDSLIPDLKGKSVSPAYYPEIRTVFVDGGGDLWLSTNGLGVYRFIVSSGGDISFKERFSTENGSWAGGSAFDNVWSIHVTAEGVAYIGGNGGMAWAKVELSDPPPVHERVAVIITDNILGAEGVFTVRGLEEDAAKVTMDYKRFSGGSVRTESVTGVPLIELLSQYGVNNDDYVVSLIAQDGFDDNGAYLDIPISEIRDKDYLVAYEVNGEAIADPISGETNMYSFSRIYRNLEKGTDKDPTDWRNRLTNILFIIVQHTDYIGDATEETAVFKVLGAVDKPGYFSLDGLASYRNLNVYSSSYSWLNRFETTGTSEMTGIYIEELLNNVMKLSDNATSITLTAADSYTVSFDLDDNELGVYWANHEGNKLMLAWAQDGVPAPLRAVVPQIGAGHINRELWANGVVSLTVNASGQLPEKLPQGAPVGLLSTVGATSAGGKGRITGTTSAMEYLDSGTWVTCTDGSTEVLPGQYGVRYAETDTHYASITVSVSVAPFQPVQPPPQSTDPTVVLSVFNGTAKTKDFTQSAISALGAVTNNYSTKNTWPTYESFANVTGVRLTAILEDAGFRLSDISNREITFYAKDNYYATLKVSDLTTARYYFNASGTRVGAAIPTAISYNADGGRLFFGQLTAQEQTRQAFVGEIDRIVIGGSVGAWGRPGANPASGRVSRGDDIRLSLPGGSGDAKIYYTIALNNGTPVAPTVESAMYNVRADRWFDKDTPENPPIKAPSDGPFTISARIIGLGKNDGPVVTFAYNGATLPQTTDQGTSGQTTGGGLGGTASVTIEIDAVPLGDAPEKVFTVAELSDKIKSAAADASGTLELKITDIAATASSVKVTLEDASVKEMIDAGLKYLIINSPLGYTAYNTEALKSIHTQGVGKISFLIRKVEIEGLDEKLKAAAAGNDVYELLVLRGDKPIIGFGSGAVVTRLPYKLGAGQSAYGVKVWRLDESAAVTELDSVYNSVRSYVQFMRSGNSYYMVGYDPGAAEWADNPFTDVVRGSWYHDSVRFMHGRGLMNGTSATLFNPNMTITRGMVVTILHRMAGSPNVAGSDNPFSDVADGAWYAAAVKWASENDIVSGYGDGRFGPNDPITREQMAAILCRYAGFAGINTSDGVDLSPFTDAGSVSAYAAQPMGWAVASGIIQGSNNKLDPKNSATRAQVAVIFERFIKGMGEK